MTIRLEAPWLSAGHVRSDRVKNGTGARLLNLGCPGLTRLAQLLMVLCCIGSVPAMSADWPCWRGPDGTAVSTETDLADSWPAEGPPLLWSVTGLGKGYASFVSSEGLLITLGRHGSDVVCVALNAESGRTAWRTTIGTTNRNVMSTPTVRDGLVYALDPDGELSCLDQSTGKLVWTRSFVADFGGRLMSGRGYGESPVVDGDRLLCTPGGADAMIVALDRRTGKTLWKTPFPEIAGSGRDGAAFSSINLTTAAGFRQIVQLTGRGLVGVDADTGRFLWSYPDISNQTANIPTPVVRGDFVFSANGYHAGSVLLHLQPKDDGTGVEPVELYRLRGNQFQNHHGGFVLIGDSIYGGHGSNNGLPTCLEFTTGKIRWKRRGPGTGSASVTAADGKLMFRYQDGTVALIAASPDRYQLISHFQTPISGGDSWSHPVITDGRLLLREQDTLWVYDVRRRSGQHERPVRIDPELASVVPAGVNIRLLTRHAREDSAFALSSLLLDGLELDAIPELTLTGEHFAEDGDLLPEVANRLQQIRTRFVLSVAGTPISQRGLTTIGGLRQMSGLDASLCLRLADDSWGALIGSPDLRMLITAHTAISSKGLASLAECESLEILDLSGCDGVSDAACPHLARLVGLRALSLQKTGFEPERVTDAGLKHLTALKQLHLLILEGNAVRDDGLTHLSAFSKLRSVNLNILPITDKGFVHLESLKSLRHLSLRYSEGFAGVILTDAGLASIGQLTDLESLNLTGARRMTDASVETLSGLSNLKFLNLTAAGLSPDGLAKLRNSLTQCSIRSSESRP